MVDRLRQILFPLLVVSIVGSLWVMGTIQEMEEDIAHGIAIDSAMADKLAAAYEAD